MSSDCQFLNENGKMTYVSSMQSVSYNQWCMDQLLVKLLKATFIHCANTSFFGGGGGCVAKKYSVWSS